jgi:ABC-type polysaccharide/polyol phosphate transport system ATPase subunit
VFATHSLALAEKWCNRAFFLEQGRIIADGPVPLILDQYRAQS